MAAATRFTVESAHTPASLTDCLHQCGTVTQHAQRQCGWRSVEQFQYLQAFIRASLLTIMWLRMKLPKDFATSYARARATLFIKFMDQAAFMALAWARWRRLGVLTQTWVVKRARLDLQFDRT